MQRFANAANWDLEQKYETRGPRQLKRKKSELESSNRLPIKTAAGIVHVKAVAPPPIESEDETVDESEAEEDAAIEEEIAEPEEEKPKIPEKQRVLMAKEELAKIASAVQEDPEENVGSGTACGNTMGYCC